MFNNQKPAILQVLPELNTGGVERGAVDLAIYARDKGYMLITASQGGKLVAKLTAKGAKHIELGLKTKNPIKIITNIFRLKKLCAENNVQLIHARSRAPAWSAYFAAKIIKLPFITTFHGTYRNNFPLKKCYNSVMAKGIKVIAVSGFVKEHILANYNKKPEDIVIVHRGIDLTEFNPARISAGDIISFKQANNISEDKKVVLLPGRITRWKGQDVAIKAISKLNENSILAVAGGLSAENNYLSELQEFVRVNNLKDKVKFLGDINNMPLAYAAADVVLSTSTEPETFGRVSAEAGAMGKPVIATRLGGSIEIIKEGETGFLVKAGDVDELAKKILYLLNNLQNSIFKNDLAINARNNVMQNFSLQNMCEKTLAIYDQFNDFRSL